jgi:hypothetical protein
MMLNAGVIPLLDHDGKEITGVSDKFFNKLSFTLATYDQKFEPPAAIRGKKGYLVLKTTITNGMNFKTSASRIYLLNQEGNWFECAYSSTYHAKGTVHNYKYDIPSISAFYQYKEYHTGSANQSSGTYDHGLHGKVEGILYY